MPQEWQALVSLANTLTVVSVLVIDLYVILSGKLNTAKHTEDVVSAQARGHEAVLVALRENLLTVSQERDRAVAREESARRELAANNAVLERLDATIRETLLRRR